MTYMYNKYLLTLACIDRVEGYCIQVFCVCVYVCCLCLCVCMKMCKIQMYFVWQGTCLSLWGNRARLSAAKHDLFYSIYTFDYHSNAKKNLKIKHALSCIYMTLKSWWNILIMSCPFMQYQAYNHLGLRLGDYKPDIALVAWHNLYIFIYMYVCIQYIICFNVAIYFYHYYFLIHLLENHIPVLCAAGHKYPGIDCNMCSISTIKVL